MSHKKTVRKCDSYLDSAIYTSTLSSFELHYNNLTKHVKAHQVCKGSETCMTTEWLAIIETEWCGLWTCMARGGGVAILTSSAARVLMVEERTYSNTWLPLWEKSLRFRGTALGVLFDR